MLDALLEGMQCALRFLPMIEANQGHHKVELQSFRILNTLLVLQQQLTAVVVPTLFVELVSGLDKASNFIDVHVQFGQFWRIFPGY
jgi:hypothetical protein